MIKKALAVYFFGCMTLQAELAEAILAGGHFWELEAQLQKIPGVLRVVNGFDGGSKKNLSDALMRQGESGYVYAVRVIFDTNTLTYVNLLEHYWHLIDPTQKNGQFCYEGAPYRSVIFYLNAVQHEEALHSKRSIEKKFHTVFTDIRPSTEFYAAEGSDQDYAKNHPVRYWFYQKNCGYEKKRAMLWGR